MTEPKRDLNWFREMLSELRLAWRLLRDPLVPTWPKLVPLAALAYVLFPLDFVPDVFIGLGQLDDVAVLLLGLKTFIASCPAEIVRRHVAEMASVIASYRVVPEDETQPASTNGYVEGEHRLLEDGASREKIEDAGAGES